MKQDLRSLAKQSVRVAITLNLILGGSWSHEPVELVYENRQRDTSHRRASPPRRTVSALQPTRRLEPGTQRFVESK